MATPESSNDDDLDQRPPEERSGITGSGASAPPIIEGAGRDLDARIALLGSSQAKVQALAADILDGMDEELQALHERTTALTMKRATVQAMAARLATDTSTPAIPPAAPTGMPQHPLDRLTGKPSRAVSNGLHAQAASTTAAVKQAVRKPRLAKADGFIGVSPAPSLNERFLRLVSEDPKQNNAHYAKRIGIPLRRASTIANSLKRAGKLKRHGKGKAITWTAA